VTAVAFASGFSSVRQFNDTVRAVYAATRSALRAAAPRTGRAARRAAAPTAGIPLRLAHRGPGPTGPVFDLLARDAVPGVETVDGPPGARTYRRTRSEERRVGKARSPRGTADRDNNRHG